MEWKAVLSLTKLLEEPPFAVVNTDDSYSGYYSLGGRKKWLAWRLERFGPIPGRESLFEGIGGDFGLEDSRNGTALGEGYGRSKSEIAEFDLEREGYSRYWFLLISVVVVTVLGFLGVNLWRRGMNRGHR